MFCRYAGIRLTGKKVPDRNIIGKVIRLPTTAADSTLLLTVPTSIPRETKNKGPNTRNGRIRRETAMWAPNRYVPTVVIRRKERIDRNVYQNIFEVNHSVFVNGVRDNCLKNLDFL